MHILKRFWPKRLYTQLLLAAAIALFIAQGINAALLLGGLKQRSIDNAAASLMNAANLQIIMTEQRADVQSDSEGGIQRIDRAGRVNRRADGRRNNRSLRRAERRIRNRSRGLRGVDVIQSNNRIIISEFTENIALSERAAAISGLGFDDKSGPFISTGKISDLPSELRGRGLRRQNARAISRPNERLPDEAMLLSYQSQNGRWINAARAIHPLDHAAITYLILQTVIIYIILLSVLAIAARRISKPLDKLQSAMRDFGGQDDIMLEENGPYDMRVLARSYNDMRGRISALLSEKDIMLGAIGHDLKTPLASLRVRVESVDDEAERKQMIGSINDMNIMLDDILTLARLGNSQEAVQKTDLSALIETVIDDFPMQSDAIIFDPSPNIIADIRPALMRRALRNLVGNALRYAGCAAISIEDRGDHIMIGMIDDGPGIANEALATIFEPFERGERSRNSSSGGSGLGLTIARAIIRAHGGDIDLTNRDDGQTGVSVIVTWPKQP